MLCPFRARGTLIRALENSLLCHFSSLCDRRIELSRRSSIRSPDAWWWRSLASPRHDRLRRAPRHSRSAGGKEYPVIAGQLLVLGRTVAHTVYGMGLRHGQACKQDNRHYQQVLHETSSILRRLRSPSTLETQSGFPRPESAETSLRLPVSSRYLSAGLPEYSGNAW